MARSISPVIIPASNMLVWIVLDPLLQASQPTSVQSEAEVPVVTLALDAWPKVIPPPDHDS